MSATEIRLSPPVPIFRSFDEGKALAFYVDYLGFEVRWRHRFEVGLPLYMELARDGFVLHLSEHHGDCTPGGRIRVRVSDIAALHAELMAKDYGFARPGLDTAPWGERSVEVGDPFGNRLTFFEPDPQPGWRPPKVVRPLAIGVVRRGSEVLVMAVEDDAGAITGWRPLGGAIEFGERAEDAVRREFKEELGAEIGEPRLVDVMENIYDHEGAPGHEIVFVFETRFADEAMLNRDSFAYDEGAGPVSAEWVGVDRFDGQTPLYPIGLDALLRGR